MGAENLKNEKETSWNFDMVATSYSSLHVLNFRIYKTLEILQLKKENETK